MEEQQLRSADKVLTMVLENPQKLKALKQNPAEELAKITKAAKEQTAAYSVPNTPIYRTVVGALGLVAVIAVTGAVVLGAMQTEGGPPDVIVALGSAAVGALAGLLAPSPRGK